MSERISRRRMIEEMMVRNLVPTPQGFRWRAHWFARLRFMQNLRYRIEYLALRLGVALVRATPLDVGVNLCGKAWRLLARFDWRHARALKNLAIAFPEKSPQEREAIALAMWENLGRVMAETMQLDRIIADPSRIAIADPKTFDRLRGKPGAHIGVTLHMGNWELAIWPVTGAGHKTAAVYRSVENPYVDRYLRQARSQFYPAGLLAKGRNREESHNTARRIIGIVRQGGWLALVCDQYDRTGLEVPFFNRPARSVTIPAIVACRVGAHISMARCLRVGNQCRFRIDVKELKVPHSANQADDVKWITAKMQEQFEAWVREAPEQWMWINRRWG
jgi:KDO2-lipid IV(A) lauroyltransferase